MTDDRDVLDELGSLLSAVEPSPTFAARIRARAASVDRRPVPWMWGVAALVASSAAVVLTVWIARPTPGRERPAPPVVVPPAVAQVAPAVQPAVAVAPVSTHRSVTGQARALAEGPAQRFMLGAQEVLVPDDQRVALIRLLAGVRVGRATVPATIVPAYDAEGLLVPLAPLVIAPLPDLSAVNGDDKPGGGPASRPGKD